MSLIRAATVTLLRPISATCTMNRYYSKGDFGSGIGKGGGTGGSIRDAGGAFGEIEYVREEEYFRKLQAEQLKALKKHHDDEIEAHEREIARHEEAINRLRKRKTDISKEGSDSD